MVSVSARDPDARTVDEHGQRRIDVFQRWYQRAQRCQERRRAV